MNAKEVIRLIRDTKNAKILVYASFGKYGAYIQISKRTAIKTMRHLLTQKNPLAPVNVWIDNNGDICLN